jgi:peroxiredoxin Q/BCP
MKKLQEGMPAPAFAGTDQQGNQVQLSDFPGSKVILFFYPKDNTPGCTAEACNLRDNYDLLLEKGFKIIGISPDTQASHQKFAEKFSLPFPLIPDPGHEILKAYGVWGPKKFMGREYEGVLRTTFVLDEKGNILKILDKVKTKDHASQILEALDMA